MNEPKKTLGNALQATRLDAAALRAPEKPHEPIRAKSGKVHNAGNPSPSRRGKVGLTIYLDKVCHTTLKQIALDEDVSIKDLIEEGINDVLQKRHRKPIA
jgi:hypothetical protein